MGGAGDLGAESLGVAEWGRIYNIKTTTLHYRLDAGLSFEQAIKEPVKTQDLPYQHNGKAQPLKQWAKEIALLLGLRVREQTADSIIALLEGARDLRVNQCIDLAIDQHLIHILVGMKLGDLEPWRHREGDVPDR